jgi:catechol 2,3-dioxygenase-like lactoylglutathione lyase family enzyme
MITPVLRVRDIDLSLAFYTRVLGFEGSGGLPGLDGQTVYAEAFLGDSRVMFSRRCGGAPLINGVELYLTLPANIEIEHFYESLKHREVFIVDDMREELWGDRAFTILDLDGNRLTFAQAIQYPVYADAEALTFAQIA